MISELTPPDNYMEAAPAALKRCERTILVLRTTQNAEGGGEGPLCQAYVDQAWCCLALGSTKRARQGLEAALAVWSGCPGEAGCTPMGWIMSIFRLGLYSKLCVDS